MLHPVDAEKDAGPELAKRHQVRGYPTFVLVDAAGEEIDRIVGYGGPAWFADALGAALADPVTVTQRQARLAAEPGARDADALGRIMAGRGDARAAIAFYRQAEALDPAADRAFAIFEASTLGYRRGALPEADLRAAADAVFARADRDPGQLLTTAWHMCGFARRNKAPALRHPYLAQAVARTAQAPASLAADRRELLVEHALHVERDRARALALKRESLPAGWRDDPDQLNGFAWWCFQNRVGLAEAEEAARRGAELAGDGADRAPILDTLAEIRLARGDARGALAAARAAAAADPGKAEYERQVRRFTEERRRRDPSR